MNNKELELFVKKCCHNRDESHNYGHMKRVAEIACQLNESRPDLQDKIYIIAMLHDVNDHKYYCHDVNIELDNYLKNNFDDYEMYLNTINAISYSKELKFGHRWYQNILTNDWLYVRDIVSDADKIEALGEIGLKRCITFEKMNYEKTYKIISHNELKKIVKNHIENKIFNLEDYIRTDKGKQIAKNKMIELKIEYGKFINS